MRYERVINRIFTAVEQLKIDGANINFPDAVRTQIQMWRIVLVEGGYTHKEVSRIQEVIRAYLEIPEIEEFYDDDEEQDVEEEKDWDAILRDDPMDIAKEQGLRYEYNF